MKKVIFYGAGELTRNYLKNGTDDYEIIAVLDRKWQEIKCVGGHKVYSPEQVHRFEYDYIIIAMDDVKSGMDKVIKDVYQYLLSCGVEDRKIILQSFKSLEHHMNRFPRKEYLAALSELMHKKNIRGDVAECGVYRGWFASMINECFPNEKLWLFDTFSGFDPRDVAVDTKPAKEAITDGLFDRFNVTSEDIVKLRCMHRENLIIRKGYVPETFEGIDSKFCFVNLDMDLYNPQLAALRFFSGKMVKGGVILVHDYYNKTFTGTTKAVDEFCEETGVVQYPIGDGLSIALLFTRSGR